MSARTAILVAVLAGLGMFALMALVALAPRVSVEVVLVQRVTPPWLTGERR